jgi:hypothetical protein
LTLLQICLADTYYPLGFLKIGQFSLLHGLKPPDRHRWMGALRVEVVLQKARGWQVIKFQSHDNWRKKNINFVRRAGQIRPVESR